MRKLSKKVRQQKAVAEAEAYVRKHGLKDVDDVAYSIAFHWGFEEDEGMIAWLVSFMRTIPDKMEAEKLARHRMKIAYMKSARSKPD